MWVCLGECMPSVCRCPRRVLDPEELELLPEVAAGNWTWFLWKSSKHSWPPSLISSLHPHQLPLHLTCFPLIPAIFRWRTRRDLWSSIRTAFVFSLLSKSQIQMTKILRDNQKTTTCLSSDHPSNPNPKFDWQLWLKQYLWQVTTRCRTESCSQSDTLWESLPQIRHSWKLRGLKTAYHSLTLISVIFLQNYIYTYKTYIYVHMYNYIHTYVYIFCASFFSPLSSEQFFHAIKYYTQNPIFSGLLLYPLSTK